MKRIVKQYSLIDICVYFHGNTFAHTWSRRNSFSRLDRTYFPSVCRDCLIGCDMPQVTVNNAHVSDHVPFVVDMDVQRAGAAGLSRGVWTWQVYMIHIWPK